MVVRRILTTILPAALLGGAAALGLNAWWVRLPPRTALARPASNRTNVSANGRVATAEEVEAGPKVGGRVIELAVKEGDRVRAGEVLGRLDDQELRARLRQAESTLAVARARWDEAKSGPRRQEVEEARAAADAIRAQLNLANDRRARVQRLFDAGVATQAELDEARRETELREAQLRGARERVALLEAGPRQETVAAAAAAYREALASMEYIRTQLDNLVVRSPMNGQVITKYLERGSVAQAGQPLYMVADTERLIVRAEVDETDAGKIRLGLPAVITSDAFPGRRITGNIHKIAWRVGRKRIRSDNPAEITDTKVLEVEIPIAPDPQLRIGTVMEVKISTGQGGDIALVPRAAIQRRGSEALVSVLKGETVEVRPVQLGASEGEDVQVLTGVKPGETVLLGRR